MVRAWSCSFQRTIKGQLRRSLRWWPPHHCSVPPLPPATLVGLISELCRNTSSTPLPPTKPAFLSLSLPTSTMCFLPQHNHSPPCSTHIPCSRPITSRTHQSRGHESWSPQGPARIYIGILRHHPEYESPYYMFILLPYAFTITPFMFMFCLCINTPVCCMYFASLNINLATYFSLTRSCLLKLLLGSTLDSPTLSGPPKFKASSKRAAQPTSWSQHLARLRTRHLCPNSELNSIPRYSIFIFWNSHFDGFEYKLLSSNRHRTDFVFMISGSSSFLEINVLSISTIIKELDIMFSKMESNTLHSPTDSKWNTVESTGIFWP